METSQAISMRSSAANAPSVSAARSSELGRIITANVDTNFSGSKAVKYRGKRSTWPGALGLFLLCILSVGGLTYFGIQKRNSVKFDTASDAKLLNVYGSGEVIADGRMHQPDPDISVTNPEAYLDEKCEQPNYISRDNEIIALYKGGKSVKMRLKGVNWLGMQDNRYVVKGLWDGKKDGNTLYRIAAFLSENKFNAVRLPLSIDAAVRNVAPDESLINTKTNRALDTGRYFSLLSTIIRGLGRFNIAIVLDFQVLSALKEETGLWEGPSIKLDDIETAISNLADVLCNSKHYNVIGLDLKDGLSLGTWGDGSETDWSVAATRLGNYLLKKCPHWLAFVQGVEGPSRKFDFLNEDGTNRTVKYKFFTGSDLTGVETAPITLTAKDKVVYSPKFYTSAYKVLEFFFSGGTPDGDYLKAYIESSNATLTKNVDLSMDYMFGKAITTGAAVILSSFGGLVGEADETEMKTSTRIIDILISNMNKSAGNLAGGFWWQLNYDAFYSYPTPIAGAAVSGGLLKESWRVANMDVLKELSEMDNIPNLNKVSCRRLT